MAGLLAIAVLFSTLASVPQGAPLPTAPATTTRVGQTYTLKASLNTSLSRLSVVERARLTNEASHPIEHVNFSVLPRAFGYFALTGAVQVDGAAVATRWTTTTNLRVQLGRSLDPGDEVLVRIPFRLRVGSSGGAFTARTSLDRGVLSLGEWFPIVSRQHDSYAVGDPQVTRTADEVTLELTTDARMPRNAVACAGREHAPATVGRHWTCHVRRVRDFSLVINPRFRLTTRTADGVTIRVYTQTVDGTVTANRAKAAMLALNDLYGQYPWSDLVLAEVGADGGFSMEYPRSIHLTRTKVTDAYVLNHEVAHQWFYAQLGNDQMRAPWLDEAFADFTARWLMGIGRSQCSTRDVDSTVFAWPAGKTTGGDWLSCDGYFHAVFYKGSEFLTKVRLAMGTHRFFSSLRAFIADHRHGLVSTRELLDFLQARSDTDLLPIYRRYLHTYD
ncbi:MAG TPA: M1 family aminopeptidase [Candidatus Limnocylindria bacterium]|nr:M1 family aminopeptidase [Candidatus Limnocylindria bacterium]